MRLRPLALCLGLALLPASSLCAASDWSVGYGANFQHDYARYSLSGNLDGEADAARRSRVSVKATHASGLELKGEWDFASGTVTDLYLDLPVAVGKLRFGQYKQPFSLDEQGSSRDLPLMERSIAHDASTIGRRVGLMWMQPLGTVQLQASGYAGLTEQISGSAGIALRGFSVARPDLHLGVAAAYEQRDDERLRLRARPESRLLPLAPLDLGNFTSVGSNARLGLEAAWLNGSWTVQSEAFALRGQRPGTDPSGQGAYLQASWLSGGHARSLREGAVRKPKFEAGTLAFELAARISRVDFDLGGAELGAQTQLGAAATVYVGARWQFSAHYGTYDADRSLRVSRPGEYSGHFTAVRAQYGF